jgi:spore coat protein U-like protein
MKRRPTLYFAAVAAVAALAMPTEHAHAANGVVTCSIVNVTLVFNTYDPVGGADDTLPTGTVIVQCSSTANQAIDVTYSLTLDTSTPRTLISGADTLTFDLFTDTTRGTPWNTTNKVSCTYTVAKNAVNQQSSCSFYPKIGGAQDVAAGTYTRSGIALGGTWSCNPAPTTC